MGGGNRSSKLVLDPRELLKPRRRGRRGSGQPLMEHPNPEHLGLTGTGVVAVATRQVVRTSGRR